MMSESERAASREAGRPVGQGRRIGGGIARLLTDFAAAVVVIAALLGGFGIDRGNAFPAPPPPELVSPAHGLVAAPYFFADSEQPVVEPAAFFAVSPFDPAASPAARQQSIWLFALGLAAMTAINLSLLRHFRAAYAAPLARRFGVTRKA